MSSSRRSILEVLCPFKSLFAQQRTWQKAQDLLTGAILCRGKRTISQVLRTLGLSHDKHYVNYYRLLNRVQWSGLDAAKILLQAIMSHFVGNQPIMIGIDETIERRWGKHIWGLGMYRDHVHSTHKHKTTSSGIRWQVMQLLVPVPWSSRKWGLPFLSVMVPSKTAVEASGGKYKTSLDWAMQMVTVVSRWLKRSWICVADGAYGNAKFGWACRRHGVSLISRLPWKAHLYDFKPVVGKKVRGRPRTKGHRLPSMTQLLEHVQDDAGDAHILRWYGGNHVLRKLVTGSAVWDVDGYQPLPIRWVLVLDPTGRQSPTVLFSTNMMLCAQDIVEIFVSRWSLEVTFEEARAHLGFQSQRQWSQAATTRTTPVILALFSLSCLMGYQLNLDSKIEPLTTAWYQKTALTFSDILSAVRFSLWHLLLFPRLLSSFTQGLLSNSECEECERLFCALAF